MPRRIGQALACLAAVYAVACAHGVEGEPGEDVDPPASPPMFGPTAHRVEGSIDPPSKVLQIAVSGQGTSCAVLERGRVYCWGRKIGDGILGTRSYRPTSSQPAELEELRGIGVAQIVMGASHACVLTTGGRVLCWGLIFAGQLATGDFEDVRTPEDVGLDHVVQISTDDSHVCAVQDNGMLWCWGNNGILQSHPDLEWANTHEGVLRPLPVPNIAGVVYVSAGIPSCAVLADDRVKCWGQGLAPDGTDVDYSPRYVPDVENALQVASAENGAMARLASGRVVAWAWAAFKSPPAYYFRELSEGPASQVVWTGNSSTFVVTTDGRIDAHRHDEAWTPFLGLEPYTSLSDVQSLATRLSDACVLHTSNVVECAGRNDAGQLGDGTTTDRKTFAPVIWPREPPILK